MKEQGDSLDRSDLAISLSVNDRWLYSYMDLDLGRDCLLNGVVIHCSVEFFLLNKSHYAEVDIGTADCGLVLQKPIHALLWEVLIQNMRFGRHGWVRRMTTIHIGGCSIMIVRA